MRATNLFFQTTKETPREAQIVSHQLLFRAGMIQQLASGIYNYLPLALRSIKKIEKIIREELDKRGCQEVLMPAVQPRELWNETDRWNYYGPELLRFKDRKEGDYCLGPTHEEVITDMVRRNLRSYRQLPWNLYQIQGKFRDEIRPRFGLMRGREFIMKDAYSFDKDEKAAMKSYESMYEAYTAIFRRCGLEFRAVDAATGSIGGDKSHEFQVLAKSGEDSVLGCNLCDYAANMEKATSLRKKSYEVDESLFKKLKKVETPGKTAVEDVADFLGRSSDEFIKSMIYMVDDNPVLIMVRGDKEVNEAKIQAHFSADSVVLADDETITEITGASVGFAGPVELKKKIKTAADYSVINGVNMVSGANLTDYHLENVNVTRDFNPDITADFIFAEPGETCPRCKKGNLNEFRGIEVGQVFYLGKKYSERMSCDFSDESGEKKPAVMGCYGIGVGRTMQAAIEQNHDDYGIIWPMSIAPYEAVVLPLQMNRKKVVEAGEEIYRTLEKAGIETVLDDRDERAGFKFNDADLLGYPVIIAIGGRSLEKGVAEVKIRKTGEKQEISMEKLVSYISEFKKKELT